MTVAKKIRRYLNEKQAEFRIITHAHTANSIQTAITAKIPLEKLVKAILLKDDVGNYVMAVIPASNRLKIERLWIQIIRW